jgi:hypothetical protein
MIARAHRSISGVAILEGMVDEREKRLVAETGLSAARVARFIARGDSDASIRAYGVWYAGLVDEGDF